MKNKKHEIQVTYTRIPKHTDSFIHTTRITNRQLYWQLATDVVQFAHLTQTHYSETHSFSSCPHHFIIV